MNETTLKLFLTKAVNGKNHLIKKGLFLFMFTIGLFTNSANAQHTWDFGNDTGNWPVAAAVTTDRIVDGLNVIANTASYGAVTANALSFSDGFSASNRFNTGGNSTFSNNLPTKRFLSFQVTGNCTIKIWLAATAIGRNTYVSDGVNLLGSNITTAANTVSATILTVVYIGAPKTLYIYSDSVWFYKLSWAPAIVWNGTAWSNGTGPNATTDAIISGTYSTTTNGIFTAKNIVVTTGGSLTVNSGTNITLAEGLVNNLPATAVVVENNANIVQTSGTNNPNTGAITVKRTTNPLMLLDYVMWGSPVSGQQLQAFSPNTLSNRFYSYNTATNLYTAQTATTNFVDGKGYLIRMPNDHPTTATAWSGSFVGVPHNGDYTFTPVVGFNSVANPYPSTISMASFVADNPSITGTLHFWRKTNSTTVLPGYCSWNNGTYVSNGQPGAISDTNGNDMLQVGQGFIVNATATSGVLFKNTQRTGNNAGQTYKSSVSTVTSSDEKNRIWLNLTSADGNFSQTAFGYMTNATNEVDSYDGESFNDGNVSISSLIADQKFVIQGKALPFENTDLVPLNYKVSQAGSYIIAIDNVDGLFANNGQTVYLRDLLLNTETNLSTGAYTFASAIGEFNNRFVVAFTPQTLGTPQFNANNVIVYKNNNNVIVNSGNIAMESVKVFDLTGRLLVDKNNINATSFNLSVNAKNQVILVQVKDINGNVVSKKVIN